MTCKQQIYTYDFDENIIFESTHSIAPYSIWKQVNATILRFVYFHDM